MSILDELNTEHGHDIQQQLMSQLGLSQQQAAAVLPKLGPIILSGLKQRMDTHARRRARPGTCAAIGND